MKPMAGPKPLEFAQIEQSAMRREALFLRTKQR
jgi:hypothetical protein